MTTVRPCLCFVVLVLAACAGPVAPDPAVCQDLIHRLCLDPRCSDVDSTLAITGDCENALLARTSCLSADFTFTTVSRERFLSCRAPLLHSGTDVQTHPDCGDVSALFSSCPDVVSFLKGQP